MLQVMFATTLLMVFATQAATSCQFSAWDSYQDTALLQHSDKAAYLFTTTSVKVDADGAPNAYHPDDVGLHCTRGTGFKGLDCPANGGYPKSSWWRSAIVPDPHNSDTGYIQPDGEFKGFFISQTSLKDKSKSDLDISKFIDSTAVPYLVSPGQFYKKSGTGALGDLGYALNLSNGKGSPFIIAEVGPPKAHLGEMSIFLASALGGNDPNPRTGSGTPAGKVVYVIFPASKANPSWPLTLEEIEQKTQQLLAAVGGEAALIACVNAN